MKIIAGLLTILIAGAGIFYFTVRQTPADQADTGSQPTPAPEWKEYKNESYAFSFKYPPEYFLEEKEIGDAHRAHYQIMLTEDTPENKAVREGNAPGREGPVAITIDIYQNNLDNLPLVEWLTGTNASNFKLSDGTYSSTTVAGKEAVSYSWSGLYEADNVAFIHNGSIFSVAGTYISPDDIIRKDFKSVLAAIKLL